MQTPEEQIGQFGTAGGEWLADDSVLNITEFAEKPTADYARTKLRVENVKEGNYLTIFGQYVIKPEIFQILEDNIQNNIR